MLALRFDRGYNREDSPELTFAPTCPRRLMHTFEEALAKIEEFDDGRPWYKMLNSYHWFVLVVAALGWLFDTMDQQLFVLARVDAMRELLTVDGVAPDKAVIAKYSGYATTIFLLGWATGGIAFGVMGDRIGRAKTMLLTILIYSLCTGLSALSTGFWDFSVYRFLTGLGVGGEFAVGVSLVAEVMPNRARPFALGLLQALSAIGNVTAALISMFLGHLESGGAFTELVVGGTPVKAWRIMFVIGILPSLLAIAIRRRLKEPERWQSTVQEGAVVKKAGSYSALFGDPRWRKRALVGLVLASAGVIGLWSIGFFTPDLLDSVLRKSYADTGMSDAEINGHVTFWKGISSLMINIGAFFGIYSFAIVTSYTGRRPAFAISFILAMGSTIMVFALMQDKAQILWMVPIMGFCQLSLFGGYAIYFPELFPTYLRSTGTSFCYNVGRIVAAVGPAALGLMTSFVFQNKEEPMRWAGVTMCSIFVIGLLALPFAPETKGHPLPE